MTDTNNSGNCSSNGTVINLGNPVKNVATGQSYIWNGSSSKWVTIPVNTCAGGTITISPGTGVCAPSTSGNIIIQTGTGQISFDDIDLAVPVDDIEENSDGCNCKKCQEFFPYAEPNQDDGTLICYGCRMSW